MLSDMQFTDADLQEYIEIWKEEFQESISLNEAQHSASVLMDLFALLLERVPETPSSASESSLPDHRT
jgi:hypothetical protein